MNKTELINLGYHNIKGWLTRIPAGTLAAILIFPLSVMTQSCFTGIESTPKITYKDVDRANVGESPEQVFARRFRAMPDNCLTGGRRYLITDEKAMVTYSAPAGKNTQAEKGDTLICRGAREAVSITGEYVAELIFTLVNNHADTLLYRPGGDISSLSQRDNLRLPFLVDLDMVENAARLLAGKHVVTRTDCWLSSAGDLNIKGRKFLNVAITGVTAYDENYPFLVKFSSLEADGESGALLMSATEDDNTPALRGFDNLFLLKDPRNDYPQISDENWALIRSGRVAVGMTTREASLALGAPRDIDRSHDQSFVYERWSYPGGVYLLFENAVLVKFNQ